MSYIRNGSNPEGLYIWGTDTEAQIVCNATKGRIVSMPIKTFKGLLKKHLNNFREDTFYRGASIREIFIEKGKASKLERELKMSPGNFQMRLSYKNWHIDMWKVTWEYILQHSNHCKYCKH